MPQTYKYFIYSAEQFKLKEKIEAKMGKKFKVGTVIYKGKKRPFTELSDTGKSNYSDAKTVAEGDITTIKYTMPKGE